MEIINEHKAREQGLKYYFTGKPCSRGHIAERFVSTRNCAECNRMRGRIENMTPVERNYRAACAKVWYYTNHEKARELNCKARRAFYRRNSIKINSESMYFLQLRKKATPLWANKAAIIEFYKNRPEGYEVDHIIPLQGQTVCGLHVENNLQYLTKLENRQKGNRFAS